MTYNGRMTKLKMALKKQTNEKLVKAHIRTGKQKLEVAFSQCRTQLLRSDDSGQFGYGLAGLQESDPNVFTF